jgi:hypothetical protein
MYEFKTAEQSTQNWLGCYLLSEWKELTQPYFDACDAWIKLIATFYKKYKKLVIFYKHIKAMNWIKRIQNSNILEIIRKKKRKKRIDSQIQRRVEIFG